METATVHNPFHRGVGGLVAGPKVIDGRAEFKKVSERIGRASDADSAYRAPTGRIGEQALVLRPDSPKALAEARSAAPTEKVVRGSLLGGLMSRVNAAAAALVAPAPAQGTWAERNLPSLSRLVGGSAPTPPPAAPAAPAQPVRRDAAPVPPSVTPLPSPAFAPVAGTLTRAMVESLTIDVDEDVVVAQPPVTENRPVDPRILRETTRREVVRDVQVAVPSPQDAPVEPRPDAPSAAGLDGWLDAREADVFVAPVRPSVPEKTPHGFFSRAFPTVAKVASAVSDAFSARPSGDRSGDSRVSATSSRLCVSVEGRFYRPAFIRVPEKLPAWTERPDALPYRDAFSDFLRSVGEARCYVSKDGSPLADSGEAHDETVRKACAGDMGAMADLRASGVARTITQEQAGARKAGDIRSSEASRRVRRDGIQEFSVFCEFVTVARQFADIAGRPDVGARLAALVPGGGWSDMGASEMNLRFVRAAHLLGALL